MASLLIFPPSIFVTAMSIINSALSTLAGISEVKGKHMDYSKFWRGKEKSTEGIILLGKKSMILPYTAGLLVSIASFFIFPNEDLRFFLLKSALSLHHFKRLFEVLFIHKYSGGMSLGTNIQFTLSYLITTAMVVYYQYLTQGLRQPLIDLKYVGIILFVIGNGGNLYHHYLLSLLRSNNGDKEYKIPKGGLFELVTCPHYLFEIIAWFGISFISQTIYPFSHAVGTTFYLIGRSYATRKWYSYKFEDFPATVKALIPFIF